MSAHTHSQLYRHIEIEWTEAIFFVEAEMLSIFRKEKLSFHKSIECHRTLWFIYMYTSDVQAFSAHSTMCLGVCCNVSKMLDEEKIR